MSTTSLSAFSAPASEKSLPSIVFRSNTGAVAPIAGPSASAGRAVAARKARLSRVRMVFIANVSLEGRQSSRTAENSANPLRDPPDEGLHRAGRRDLRLHEPLDLLAQRLVLPAREDGAADLGEAEPLGL